LRLFVNMPHLVKGHLRFTDEDHDLFINMNLKNNENNEKVKNKELNSLIKKYKMNVTKMMNLLQDHDQAYDQDQDIILKEQFKKTLNAFTYLAAKKNISLNELLLVE
jgi:hypothetical protein